MKLFVAIIIENFVTAEDETKQKLNEELSQIE